MAHDTTYTAPPEGKAYDWQNIKRMLPYVTTYYGRVSLALFCLIGAKVATVGAPLMLKEIVDRLDASKGTPLVLPLFFLLGYGSLRMANAIFTELRASLFAKVRYAAMRTLSCQVLRHLHNLSLRYHLDRKTGAVIRDLERGTQSIGTVLNYISFTVIPTLIEFGFVAIILLQRYSFWFTVVTFGAVAVYTAFTIKAIEWRMHFRFEMNKADSKANSCAVDSLINYETVKYFNNDELELKKYEQNLLNWEENSVKSQISISLVNAGQGIIIALGVTAIMLLAGSGVVQGTMSIGDLVLVNALLLQLFLPLNFLGVIYRQIKYNLADMDSVFKLLALEIEVKETPGAKPLQVSLPDLEFRAVTFYYNPDRRVIHNLSFTIPAGKKLAIVGASGAGKSTLARLLYRFYDVSEGEILINGQEIRQVTLSSLRNCIGIVPQDTVLLNESIFYNIAYAKPGATEEEVIAAAKMANIHDFIVSLQDGYQTLVGERGLKLSGGEKQRVAIARVILKQPQILVFDEATSALDSQTEQVILQSLNLVSQNFTTLVIAHRLSTIVDADQILVLDQGTLVEQGSHRELLARQGVYAHLWELQQQEKENEAPTA